MWLGGESPKQLERAGKYGDGWLATAKSLPTLKDDFAIAQEAASNAGRDPAKLKLAIEGVGALTTDNLDETAQRLGKLKEMGIDHAILSIHPRHLANATPVIDAFAAQHLPALRA